MTFGTAVIRGSKQNDGELGGEMSSKKKKKCVLRKWD